MKADFEVGVGTCARVSYSDDENPVFLVASPSAPPYFGGSPFSTTQLLLLGLEALDTLPGVYAVILDVTVSGVSCTLEPVLRLDEYQPREAVLFALNALNVFKSIAVLIGPGRCVVALW